jgi:hypothetical protein
MVTNEEYGGSYTSFILSLQVADKGVYKQAILKTGKS